MGHREIVRATYSKMRDGFQDGGSAIESPCGRDGAWEVWPDPISTSDCIAGEESLLLSTGPAEIGGVMG
jgi:hypothetical protein